MSLPRRSLLLFLPAGVVACNLIFGIEPADSGVVASSSTHSATSSSGPGGNGGGNAGGGDAGTCSPDRVVAPLDGGACPAPTLPKSQDVAEWSLFLQGDYLYASTGDGNVIDRVRYDGTGFIPFTTGDNVANVTSDGTYLYWSSWRDALIQGITLAGTSPYVVANWSARETDDAGPPQGGLIAWHGGKVYWTTLNPPAIFRADTSGAMQQVFDTIAIQGDPNVPVTNPSGLAVDDEHVYWSDPNGNPSAVMRLALADIGKGVAAEVFAADNNVPVAITLDADRVYWISTFGWVQSKPKSAGGNLSPVIYDSATKSDPTAIAVDESYVYWLTNDGVVTAMKKAGGMPIPIGCGAPRGTGLAVDCGAVYWTALGGDDGDGGMIPSGIFKAAKPAAP